MGLCFLVSYNKTQHKCDVRLRRHVLRAGFSIKEIFNLTKIDRWFLVQIKEIVDFEEELASRSFASFAGKEVRVLPLKGIVLIGY